MFEKFESVPSTKEMLAQQICQALTVHARIEEEISYPAAREALGENGEDLLGESKIEHNSLKELIGHIEGSSAHSVSRRPPPTRSMCLGRL